MAAARSTRDRPAKAPLSEAVIIDAALSILQADGLEAVTMRRVAQRLDTGPASLYVYVAGRERLLLAMLDRATASIELEPVDPSRWRAQVHGLLGRIRRVFEEHPGLAGLTLGQPPVTESVLLVSENLMGLLIAGGVDPQGAAWAIDILMLIVTGVALEHGVRSGSAHPDDWVESIGRTFAGLSPDRFPLLSAHAAQLVAGDVDKRFGFAIDAVLDGALARAA